MTNTKEGLCKPTGRERIVCYVNQSERQARQYYQKGDIVLKKYRMIRPLGEGGMGCVYLAMDLHINQKVAVKVMLRSEPSDGKEQEKELELLRELQHSMLPRVLDYEKTDFCIILVMEYVEGINLEEYLKGNGPVSEKQALKWGLSLLQVLEFFHTHHPAVIYQDLKPANIILRTDGRLSLVDLGGAFFRTFDGQRADVVGSVLYASPEQRGGTAEAIDERSDLYTWGRTMLAFLVGDIGSFEEKKLHRHRKSLGFSKELARILERCCREKKEERFSSASEVRNALLTAAGSGRAGKKRKKIREFVELSAILFLLLFYWKIGIISEGLKIMPYMSIFLHALWSTIKGTENLLQYLYLSIALFGLLASLLLLDRIKENRKRKKMLGYRCRRVLLTTKKTSVLFGRRD